MAKQTSPHPKISPPSSNGGMDKAVAALGGGILAAGLGASFPLALVGCAVGYTIAYLAEKQRTDKN